MMLVVGIISFDLAGQYYLQTFSGRFPIPDVTFQLTAELIEADEEHQAIRGEVVAGKLARGRIENGIIVDLSYWMLGREWPSIESKDGTGDDQD